MCITAIINHDFILFFAVQIHDLLQVHVDYSQSDQLTVGLIPHILVSQIMGSNTVLEFFSGLISQLLKLFV